MGAAASIDQPGGVDFAAEASKPADAGDLDGKDAALAEVARLRQLLLSAAQTGFDLRAENYEGDFAAVAEGVWSVCTQHHPGNIAAMPEHNNRSWVLHVRDADDGDFLLVYGLPEEKVGAPKVRAVEVASGLKVKYIMTSGCWHHLYLDQWLASFPDAQFLFPKAKFPETRNGKQVLADQAKAARVLLYDTEDDMPVFGSGGKYLDQLRFVVSDQQTTYPDEGPLAATADLVPTEAMGEVMSHLAVAKKSARFAATALYHVATKTLSIDHNFDMFQPGELWDKQPEMLQQWHPRAKLMSGVMTGQVIIDPAKNFEQVGRLLALDVRCIVDLHTEPTYYVEKSFGSQEAYVSKITSVFEESGELDATGASLPQNKQKPKEEAVTGAADAGANEDV